MFFVLQTANVTADAKNCVYPNRKEITSGDELKEAVRFDHVCGEFKKNYRNISNFVRSDVIVMDCDNDHSEDPAEWITFKRLENLFEEIEYADIKPCFIKERIREILENKETIHVVEERDRR